MSDENKEHSSGERIENLAAEQGSDGVSCTLFKKRGFHDWRYLGYPLTNPSCTEHWCAFCGLRQIPRIVNGQTRWVDAGRKDDKGCLCQRCGDEYKVDINVPDELWAKIHGQLNLLCGACITKAIERLGRFDSFTLARADSDASPDDDYIAWCTYSHHEDGTTTISTCDSDTKGAFKVYRGPTKRIL